MTLNVQGVVKRELQGAALGGIGQILHNLILLVYIPYTNESSREREYYITYCVIIYSFLEVTH